ncbi:hypothetical protein [Sphingobacterium kyonggiense]
MNNLENKETYEAPKFQEIKIELEYGIAATSVEPNGMKESWNNNSTSQDLEW